MLNPSVFYQEEETHPDPSTLWTWLICLQLPQHLSTLFHWLLMRGVRGTSRSPSHQHPQLIAPWRRQEPCATLCPSGTGDKTTPLLPAEETSVPGVYGGPALTSLETKQKIMLEDHFSSSFPVKSSSYLQIHSKLRLVRVGFEMKLSTSPVAPGWEQGHQRVLGSRVAHN